MAPTVTSMTTPPLRRGRCLVGLWMTACSVGAISAPPSHAEDLVTYEIVSRDITVVDVEYRDASGRTALRDVALPWQSTVIMANARSTESDGAEVRADWRPAAAPSRWVTVRVYLGHSLLCQSTMDVGNATCLGGSPHVA